MGIIQAGKQFTADDLRSTLGNHAAMLRDILTDLMQINAQLKTWPDPDLLALEPGPSGRALTQDEVNAQKGFAIGDAPPMYDLMIASTWIKQLLGTGV